jgi:hypothetical protein
MPMTVGKSLLDASLDVSLGFLRWFHGTTRGSNSVDWQGFERRVLRV